MTTRQAEQLNRTQYGTESDKWYRLLRLLVPELSGLGPDQLETRYSPCMCETEEKGKCRCAIASVDDHHRVRAAALFSILGVRHSGELLDAGIPVCVLNERRNTQDNSAGARHGFSLQPLDSKLGFDVRASRLLPGHTARSATVPHTVTGLCRPAP